MSSAQNAPSRHTDSESATAKPLLRGFQPEYAVPLIEVCVLLGAVGLLEKLCMVPARWVIPLVTTDASAMSDAAVTAYASIPAGVSCMFAIYVAARRGLLATDLGQRVGAEAGPPPVLARPRSYIPVALALGASAYALTIAVGAYFPLLPDTEYQGKMQSAEATPIRLGAVLVAPALEETVFRGFFYSAIESAVSTRSPRLAVPAAAVITCVAFVAIHLSLYSTASWEVDPTAILSVTLGSVSYTALWVLSRSVVPGILAHLIKNALSVSL